MDLALAFEDAQPVRLTVDQYLEMMHHGIIEEGSRVELLEGLIVSMNARSTSHALITSELAGRFRDRLRELGSPLKALVTPSIAIPSRNALDPDVAILVPQKPGRGFFPVERVRLLVEVSNTSLRKDLRFKRDIYAAAAVPEYWVVDADNGEVHRFASPRAGVYTAEPTVPLAGELHSLTMPDLVIDGTGIL